MSLEGFIGNVLARGFVAIQRPLILVLMTMATAAFTFLGFYAILKIGQLLLTAEWTLKADAPWWAIPVAVVLLLGAILVPFLLARISWRYAGKALRQIREDGMIYSEDS